jgi:heme-degrading monooxygenase HmoA
MFLRILMITVVPGRRDDWFAYTRDIGFPGMRAQPGCRAIHRLHQRGQENGYAILTLWDSAEDFERFKASPALAELGKHSQGLTIRPYSELLFDLVPDRHGGAADLQAELG